MAWNGESLLRPSFPPSERLGVTLERGGEGAGYRQRAGYTVSLLPRMVAAAGT